ncbi:response regulator [Fortiea sp. LEGE XX443]|uniref:hybrid sensor histidine kinase/response regulator n=1 Tax=Fortiea sp. LEGE XX443 TaxID=1828611 RepID=UPI00187F592A|nr:ATP-binding protein [Fortiea sp. LEGE XX443]MBE9007788.1 response regulator [Fortiea sp. LEGE XX443]
MPETWTLLIIDDCAEDRKIYRRYLLKDPQNSYQIFEADSAEEGLALCQTTYFDVILLDFCLPDMSGLDLLERLKKYKFETPVSIIMLTGRGDEEVAVQAMKQGAQDYLVKQHLQLDVLQLAVRSAIKQSCLKVKLSKTQERQRLIATTALRIRQSLNLEEILHTAVVEVQQLLKCDRVMVYQFSADMGGKMVAASSQEPEQICNHFSDIYYHQETERIPSFVTTQVAGTTTTTRQKSLVVAYSNLGENHRWRCRHRISRVDEASLSHFCFHKKEQVSTHANLVVPINLNNNNNPNPKLWGFLIAQPSSQDRLWPADEVEMLNQVSVQLAIAIQQAELLAMTQAALVKEKQLNEFKSQIVTTVSHEYRTPLATILAAASTIKQHGARLDEAKKNRFLQIIEQKARHMSKLVDDMLLVHQLELDKTKFKPQPLDLLQFVSELIEEQQEVLDNRYELILKITGNNREFSGDRGLLRQILLNLLSNAIKYSPEGGNIEIHLNGKESEILLEVQDQGIGIPTLDQENLFKSFSRGSNVDTIPGTGLGLVITKACVELHGGSITLSSQVGLGTKVTIRLPKRHNYGNS